MKLIAVLLVGNFLLTGGLQAQTRKDSIQGVRTYAMEEVVVTGTRHETDIRHLPMTISVVDRGQIYRRYEQSLLPVLTEQVPGLFVTSRGIMGYGVSSGAAGGMRLRGVGGSPTTGLLMLVDGHPQYMGLMGHPLADTYQSMLADKVEVVRGPASVLYGSNAMGGVINIVTRKQQEEGVKNQARVSYGSYNTLTSDFSNMIRKGKFSSVITASYNRTDGHRADMNFEQYGGYAKLGYDFSSKWKAFADVNLTHFNASNPGTVGKPILDYDSRITRGMTSLSIENNYGRTSGALKVFYNWGRHKINDGYFVGAKPLDYRFNSKDRMLGITWYQSFSFFEGNRMTVGVDYQHMGGDAWKHFVTDGHDENMANRSENEIAGYIDFRQMVGELLTIDAGLRVDHHSQAGTEWIPQLGLALNLLENGELKAMASKGFRNPTLKELYMFDSRNPDLLPEEMMNYELSWAHRLLDNALSYGLNLFYIKGDNMIETISVDGRDKNVNTGSIENWGIEASMNYRLNPVWAISSNYSWLHMVHPVVAAPEHKLYVGVDFSVKQWRLATGVQYVAGLYTTPSVDSTENFVLWNVRGSYRLSSFVELFARGENLLAQRYEINAGFPMPKATLSGGINLSF